MVSPEALVQTSVSNSIIRHAQKTEAPINSQNPYLCGYPRVVTIDGVYLDRIMRESPHCTISREMYQWIDK